MSFVLGLTGSIGMGKSTTSQMFRELGFPVWDADQAVHRLYGAGGAAVDPIAGVFPDAVVKDQVDRGVLKQIIAGDPTALPRLEAIVHPLVATDRADFLRRHADQKLVVLDVPLLFEAGGYAEVDGVAVVSTDAQTQRDRVMARPGMSAQNFQLILSRQMPDDQKRARADWVIPTDTLDGARVMVEQIVRKVTADA